ncbi:hypothetical protein PHLGIDRAFT_119521, partial [Phlebiopsis gigantea 11061_1 CR5-6]
NNEDGHEGDNEAGDTENEEDETPLDRAARLLAAQEQRDQQFAQLAFVNAVDHRLRALQAMPRGQWQMMREPRSGILPVVGSGSTQTTNNTTEAVPPPPPSRAPEHAQYNDAEPSATRAKEPSPGPGSKRKRDEDVDVLLPCTVVRGPAPYRIRRVLERIPGDIPRTIPNNTLATNSTAARRKRRKTTLVQTIRLRRTHEWPVDVADDGVCDDLSDADKSGSDSDDNSDCDLDESDGEADTQSDAPKPSAGTVTPMSAPLNKIARFYIAWKQRRNQGALLDAVFQRLEQTTAGDEESAKRTGPRDRRSLPHQLAMSQSTHSMMTPNHRQLGPTRKWDSGADLPSSTQRRL